MLPIIIISRNFFSFNISILSPDKSILNPKACLEFLIPSNDSSDVLASKTPSAKSLRVSVTTTTTTSATNSFSADCPLSTSRSYFQIKSEEDDGYYEIIADEIHDVYFLKAFDETL